MKQKIVTQFRKDVWGTNDECSIHVNISMPLKAAKGVHHYSMR